MKINGYTIEPGALLEGAYLRGADLRRAILYDANLEGVNLRGAYLQGANLRRANLRYANLRDANLRDADLEGADLEGAYLEGAYLEGADLRGADLFGADLFGADLEGANLRGADLEGADLAPYRADLWAVLDTAPNEVQGVIDALKEGRVDGSTYTGDYVCLIGTIAKVRGCAVNVLPKNASRPAEMWFSPIRPGHTPTNNPRVAETLSWVEQWQIARATAKRNHLLNEIGDLMPE